MGKKLFVGVQVLCIKISENINNFNFESKNLAPTEDRTLDLLFTRQTPYHLATEAVEIFYKDCTNDYGTISEICLKS